MKVRSVLRKGLRQGPTQEAITQTRLLSDTRVHPQVDQLMALWAQSTIRFRRSSLRSSPCFIRCTPGVGLRTDLFFLIFINDLPDNIKSSVRLFADDCVLYRNIHSLQDCLILQEDLDSLGLWEADWQMKFQYCQMSLCESDPALLTQTNHS